MLELSRGECCAVWCDVKQGHIPPMASTLLLPRYPTSQDVQRSSQAVPDAGTELGRLQYNPLTNQTNQQHTHLYKTLSFPSHSASTRSYDTRVLPMPYVRSSLDKGASSFVGPRLHSWNSLPPDTHDSTSPIFRSKLKHTASKLHYLPKLFLVSLDCDCLPGFLLFSYFMPYRVTLCVRHRIEVH